MTWKPIDTYRPPTHDIQLVLLRGVKEPGTPDAICWYAIGVYTNPVMAPRRWYEWSNTAPSRYLGELDPTHWDDLPAPPVDGDTKEIEE